MTTILEVEDVQAGYGDFQVLKGASLTVEEGQIVCIIGPNGAGKSTLFKTIFGLLSPTAGTIEFNGTDIVGASQRDLIKQGISYVLQRNASFPKMTVRENLELGAYVADDDYPVDEKIDELFEIFPVLEEKQTQKAGTLSGGQQQMVEFGRGLMLDPSLLLLDEPTAGLAPKIIDTIFEKVQAINELGVTVLMVEQNVKTGVQYADHVYVFENGQTKFDDDAETVLDRPEIRDAYLKGVKTND